MTACRCAAVLSVGCTASGVIRFAPRKGMLFFSKVCRDDVPSSSALLPTMQREGSSLCTRQRLVNEAGAVSSAVEHYLDMVGVTGSKPVPPTTRWRNGASIGWDDRSGRFLQCNADVADGHSLLAINAEPDVYVPHSCGLTVRHLSVLGLLARLCFPLYLL